MTEALLPREAEVVERIQESSTIFTLRLRMTDTEAHARYEFAPGQFNMLYLYGVGEVPISIVSDPEDDHLLDHTIRALGRVTDGLARLEAGARVGIRGPFGRGWPLAEARGRDVVLVTGGLGCAPVMSVINYVTKRRGEFGRLTIIQGVKHSDDLIWRTQYERWAALPQTQVLLAADVAGPGWHGAEGPVTVLFDQAEIDPERAVVMMCGPERMMQASAHLLLEQGIPAESLWLSLERNMQCAVGHCGHCQMGPHFVCKNGPVFSWPEISDLFGTPGF
ncbi:MAG: FAD/NAD(P)-binding protein [Acidihalobacter sp.]|jgi:sulfhydrogenase subunit gamma (sulfur reductase)